MTADNALFNMGNGPESDLEREISAFISSLEEQAPLTPSQRVTASMCRSLAKSITTGNAKGRSVANDVERLDSIMRQLSGEDDAQTDADLTPAERELLDALSSVPGRNGDPEEGYAT